MGHKTVRIGGASGFWGDSITGPLQLLQVPGIEYITFDYLAELTLAIMAGSRMKDPNAGYATDFAGPLMKAMLPVCKARGIRLISNAGGLNPHGCAAAVHAVANALGLDIKIAVVDGDDVQGQMAALREAGATDLHSGAAMPLFTLTANAYLGAFPIAQALAGGADIVITGRTVDSALVLGALIHEHGWQANDFDALAQGSLAGHIIECGAQATGGLHTDWDTVPQWENIGYPVIDVDSDGSFIVSKPEGTGGLINVATVSEQLLYEIGDPSAYLLPDVIADFTQVRIEPAGDQRVRVSNAKGYAPTGQLKVCATYVDGYKSTGLLTLVGERAAQKAQRTGEAILARTRTLFEQQGLGDYQRARVDVLGTASDFGPHVTPPDLFEAVVRISVHHTQKKAVDLFSREIAPAGTSWAPGTTGNFGIGRPSVSPMVALFSCMIDAGKVQVCITHSRSAQGAEAVPAQAHLAALAYAGPFNTAWGNKTLLTVAQVPGDAQNTGSRKLLDWCFARSGDKGDTSNIGVVCRRAEDFEALTTQVNAQRVLNHMQHLVQGEVRVYSLPGIRAVNVVMARALDGGGMRSMRNDPLGKGLAQVLLQMRTG